MNILLTVPRFWPLGGGKETVVAELAKRFVHRGHDVTVATSHTPGTSLEERRDGYVVRRFPLRRVGRFGFAPRAYRRFVSDAGWDVVHLHGQRVWSTDGLIAHMDQVHAPVVWTPHGLYQMHMERSAVLNEVYYRAILPRALREATATALTESEEHELTFIGFDDVRIISNGFDPAQFDALPDGFRQRHGIAQDEAFLLYVGGFYPNKRVDRLVELAAATNTRLVVIGRDDDPERGLIHCRKLAESLGASVDFLGHLPREEVLAAYRAATLFVLASDFEGFGLVLLEAMAARLPFVSTPVGAAPDLARHGGGVIAASSLGLGKHVRALLEDPERRMRMGVAGREALSRYTWDSIADEYLALYEEVATS